MMERAILTKRETEIAELFAWGASKKDVANRLFISERTVENHTRNIYAKIGCQKVNELCAWWFCTTFHISFELSPLKRKLFATMCLILMIPSILNIEHSDMMRCRTTRTTSTRTIRSRRGRDGEDVITLF
jgi:DNA-binding CsgD family transcriptional regulator